MSDRILIRRSLLAAALVVLAACTPEPDRVDQPDAARAPAPTAAAEAAGPPAPDRTGVLPAADSAAGAVAAADAVADTLLPFSERVVVFIEASKADLDAARASRDEETYYVMADDLMWYRATAHEFLEKNGLPIRRLEGRQPLRFIVNGQSKAFDYSDVTTLDVIILYDTNREPVAAAPVDIEEAARSYFHFD